MSQVPTEETSKMSEVPNEFMVGMESQNLVDYVRNLIFPFHWYLKIELWGLQRKNNNTTHNESKATKYIMFYKTLQKYNRKQLIIHILLLLLYIYILLIPKEKNN